MSLVLNSTYQNVGFDYILDGIRDLLVTEFNYGKIYISPDLKFNDPFQIRLWLSESSTGDYNASSWQKEYTVDIDLYMIDSNHDENTYKQLHQDTERIYQLLFNNAHKEITVANNSLQWLNGRAETIGINEFEGDEEEVEGLLKSTLSFTCNIHAGQLISNYNTKSLAFDGANDYVNCGSNSSLDMGAGAYSVSIWVYPTDEAFSDFIGRGTSLGTGHGWALSKTDSETIYFDIGSGGVRDGMQSTTGALTLNTWQHIVAVRPAGATAGRKIYLNGIDVTASEPHNVATCTDSGIDLWIGRSVSDRYMEGNVDEVSIWGTVLSQSAVTELYNSGKPKDIRLGTFKHLFDIHCKGYWRMGDGTLDDGNVDGNGLIADQTNPTLGAELVNNDNWAVTGCSNNNGILTFTDNSGDSYASLSGIIPSGITYKFTYTVDEYTSGGLVVWHTTGSAYITMPMTVGEHSVYIKGRSASNFLIDDINVDGEDAVFVLSNISIKPVNGNPGMMTNMTSSDIETETP